MTAFSLRSRSLTPVSANPRPVTAAVLFIHIPKAAGTSLRNALRRELGKRLVPVYDSRPSFTTDDLLRRDNSDCPVTFGHFSYGLHERLGVAPNYATVLRDPVERVVSWYRWQATHPHLPLHERIKNGLTLERMLEETRKPELFNLMTAYISGRGHDRIPDEVDLERAKVNLRTFRFVSTVERLQSDLPALNAALGTSLMRLPHQNASGRMDLPRTTLCKVREVNALDIELFTEAQRLARWNTVPFPAWLRICWMRVRRVA